MPEMELEKRKLCSSLTLVNEISQHTWNEKPEFCIKRSRLNLTVHEGFAKWTGLLRTREKRRGQRVVFFPHLVVPNTLPLALQIPSKTLKPDKMLSYPR